MKLSKGIIDGYTRLHPPRSLSRHKAILTPTYKPFFLTIRNPLDEFKGCFDENMEIIETKTCDLSLPKCQTTNAKIVPHQTKKIVKSKTFKTTSDREQVFNGTSGASSNFYQYQEPPPVIPDSKSTKLNGTTTSLQKPPVDSTMILSLNVYSASSQLVEVRFQWPRNRGSSFRNAAINCTRTLKRASIRPKPIDG